MLRQSIDNYILGDMLLDGDFRDAVIDAMAEWIKVHRKHLRAELYYIYENTKENDPLRSLAIDTLVFNNGP